MKSALEKLSNEEKKLLKKRKQPEWAAPMLATLTHRTFSDKKWLFERKLDGERCLAFRKGKRLRLLSRNRKKMNVHYPELAEALLKQENDDFIVDGEIVAFEDGLTSFSRLQPRIQVSDPEEARRSGIAVFYYLFDLLYLDGFDTSRLPLRTRKSLIKKAFSFKDPLRFTAHRNEKGQKYYEEACRKGWEGLIAKDAASAYAHSRSRNWLKFKCVNQQEFVIGGFTEPKGSRTGFGALLIGYFEDGQFRYAGKVGTGYDEETLKDLRQKLSSLEQKKPPFTGEGIPRKEVHWVKPRLVAQIGFTEWTSDHKLRHPRYLGLRRDKNPGQVVREQAKMAF